MQTIILLAQSVERPKPWFTLSITEKDLTTDGSAFPEDHILLVTYTNISDTAEDNSMLDPHTLNMIVLYDGSPADETKLMRQERKYREAVASGKALGIGRVPGTLKPGESVAVPLCISDYFKMSKPGTYTITVNKETYPWDPAKSVMVWSNTLTIVLPSDNHPPTE
jgi:hypothetical protein